MNNLLFSDNALLAFKQINPIEAYLSIHSLLVQSRQEISFLCSKRQQKNDFNFDNFVFPFEMIKNKVKNAWSLIEHLNAVIGSEEWQKTYHNCLPIISKFYLELKQDRNIFDALLNISANTNYKRYNYQQKKVIENLLRDSKLAGVSLSKEKKIKLNRLQNKILTLENTFAQNIIEATSHWSLLIKEKKYLQGVPNAILQLMKTSANQQNKKGYLITLDYSIYHAILCYADNRNLRKKIYTAYYTLASNQNKATLWDNGPIIVSLLNERQKLAKLLGFKNYAEYGLCTRMLKTPVEVLDFLHKLLEKFQPKARDDIQELNQFAEKYGVKNLEAWDVAYFSEKLREEKYSFNMEELRSYFAENTVLQGLFVMLNKLYKIDFKEIIDFDAWHASVRLFEVYNAAGKICAKIYLDLFERPRKRKGAWYGDCRTRIHWKNKKNQIPIAYIVANFRNKEKNEIEAFLSNYEVNTLFHEFGHALHHILTKVDFPNISGGNGVSWDAIEVPSQFMENWCFEAKGLQFISKHKKTRKTLPNHLIKKIQQSKNFLNGLSMLRQLEFSLFDFQIHTRSKFKNYEDIQLILQKIQEKTAVYKVPNFNRYINTFAHIFAGPYAAGYYSYLWSEVLSSDIFSIFKNKGNIFDQRLTTQFLTKILQKGGSKDFITLFTDFMHRKPEITAFLKSKTINI